MTRVAQPPPMKFTAGVKPISPKTVALLEQIAAAPGWVVRLLGRSAHPTKRLLEEVANSGEIEAALGLLPIALATRGLHREDVLRAIDKLVRDASTATFVWLDQRARELSPDAWASSDSVTPDRVDSLPVVPASAAGVASLHRSGYVRERAARLLLASTDAVAVTFLLLRANDWVEEVRAVAQDAIQRRIAAGDVQPFVANLDLVFRLSDVRRNDLRALVDAIRGAIASPSARDALRAGCQSHSRSVRRRCIAIAMEARTFDLRPMIHEGLQDPDAVVRGVVAKAVGAAFEGTELRDVLDRMLDNRSPRVRYSALEILWARFGTESRATQERLLFDPHPHVRGTARWFLKSVPDFSISAFYRGALAGLPPRTLAGAIEGLGEVGTAEDATRVAPFLRHERPRVRTAAVRALGNVGAAHYREAVIAALSDPSPRVSRAARDVLLRGPPVDPDRLTYAALRARFPHERRGAVDLVRRHDHWTAGLLLLRIAGGGGEDAASRAAAALWTWEARYNRVFTPPTAAQVAEFKEALASLNAEPALLSRLRSLVPALEMRTRSS